MAHTNTQRTCGTVKSWQSISNETKALLTLSMTLTPYPPTYGNVPCHVIGIWLNYNAISTIYTIYSTHITIYRWMHDLYMLSTPSDFIASRPMPPPTEATKRRYYVCAKSVHQLPRYTPNTDTQLPKHNPTVRTRFVLEYARIRKDGETLPLLYKVAQAILLFIERHNNSIGISSSGSSSLTRDSKILQDVRCTLYAFVVLV